ncbi:MAG: glycoside hydrolase family 25 protein [Eubacterium sp.]|nr:glycoside hydrolase family 25 protein [Eubacterium sp.]
MKMKGIDVSYAQGDIDFKQVKNLGIDYVIIRAGWGTEKVDDWFEENYRKSTEAGLYVGAYWYCYGETISEIEQEANAFLNALDGKTFEFPVYMDLEENSQFILGEEFCSNAVKAFCSKLEQRGYFAGLYTSTSFLDTVIDEETKKKYTIWVADWRGYCGYKGNYGMWQYGAGYVPGINGKTDFNMIDSDYNTDYPGKVVKDGVDLDYAYEDFPMEIILGGYNNYPKPDAEESDDDTCTYIEKNIELQGITPKITKENWLLIDKSGSFTLTPLFPFRANVYLVGGGEDGAEWEKVNVNGYTAYDIEKKCQGGCVLQREINITSAVQCRAIVAERNNTMGTSLRIGDDLVKCTDEGYVQRKATANGSANKTACTNGESGANGIKTPYGYVGSSGGGGGTHSSINGNILTVYAGKGGEGAGNGGELKQSGEDAVNYGCGGGSAGFGGFPSREETMDTKAGKGMQGCIIIEILDSDCCNAQTGDSGGGNSTVDGSSNGWSSSSGGNGNGSNSCCPHHEFTCLPSSIGTSNSVKETAYSLSYANGEPVETDSVITDTSNSSFEGGENTSGASNSHNSSKASSCNCSSSSSGSAGCSSSCGCGSGSSGKTKCISLDVEKWGENWLLFDKDGSYSLTLDEDLNLKMYLVGGGSDGEAGIYFNGTAYGGNGGKGGYYNIIPDVKVDKGQMYIDIKIGRRGVCGGTSVVINNNEYCCNGKDSSINDGGFQGINGKHGFQHAGNGANGIETPFGYIGSSGGGGAAYCNSETVGRGRGGLYAGNGGKIEIGKSTPGDKATGYGCGGGGGSASPTSWCEGGEGKQGCVIITW